MKRRNSIFLPIALVSIFSFMIVQADARETAYDYVQSGLGKARSLYEAAHEYVTQAKAKRANATQALWQSIEKNDVKGIENAIAAGADVHDVKTVTTSNGSNYTITPLHKVALHGQLDEFRALVKGGASVNVTTEDHKDTPLHEAALMCEVHVIQELLENKANPSASNFVDDTPLHKAAKCVDPRSVKMLIAAGVDVNARDILDQTPLHEAATYNAVDTMKELIAHGADAQAQSYYGTPAERAAQMGGVEAVKYLVSIGAAPEELIAEAEAVAAQRKAAQSATPSEPVEEVLGQTEVKLIEEQ